MHFFEAVNNVYNKVIKNQLSEFVNKIYNLIKTIKIKEVIILALNLTLPEANFGSSF